MTTKRAFSAISTGNCKYIRLLYGGLFFVYGLYPCGAHAQAAVSQVAESQAPEPYKPIHGGHFSGARVRESPDPLVAYHWDDPRVGDSLEIHTLKPVSMTGTPIDAFVIHGKNVGDSKGKGNLEKGNTIIVRGKGSLRLDFGVESAGWLEFDSDDLPDSVEMSISEYNEPAIVNVGAQHPVKTARPVKYGHTYRLELNDQLYEGVRFGWIHTPRYSGVWHIRNPRLVCQVRPVNYNGSFSCSDPLLTRIWYTGAYTVRLNLLQHYFGAILMERSDRQSWTGDAHPAQAAALAAFGNDDFIRENLRITSGQSNGIASYSLYWVLSLIDYYDYTGDSAFFREYIANADKKLEKAYQGYDSLPFLGFTGWDERLGAGFEDPQTMEAQHTYRMLCINTWNKMAAALLMTGQPLLAAKYQGYVASKRSALLKEDLAGSPDGASSFGVHAIAEAVNAGLSEDPVVAARSEKLFADRLNRLSYSPFNQYFIIQAMALAGDFRAALTTIKDCWGGQVDYGGTCFFEVYRPSWNAILRKNDPPPNNQCGYTSLAHPWGAGVTKWLSENILGIRPLQPGFKRFTIFPHLNRELNWVQGSMPTPAGPIKASFDTRSGVCGFVIPAGLIAERIAIPREGWEVAGASVNELPLQEPGNAHGIGAVENDSQYIYLTDVQPGHYVVKLAHKRKRQNGAFAHAPGKLPSCETEKDFAYPILSFSVDSVHSGHWKDRYGEDGYELFGYGETGRSWPGYIERVQYNKSVLVVWDSTTNDNRVLFPPGMTKGKAAAIITRDPDPTYQTFTIDVVLKKEHPYFLSLYFLDWSGSSKNPVEQTKENKKTEENKKTKGDKQTKDNGQTKAVGRQTAVEIFDLRTLDILAPVEMVRDYTRGKYIRFRFDKSVRIRIDQVRGKNAAVSGIFFDPG